MRAGVVLASLMLLNAASYGADKWTVPTAAELAMTSVAQVPGAPAVILYREVVADDSSKSTDYYVRVKVLTEGGKDQATIELPATLDEEVKFDNIAGRTIEPDGTIVAFTGKPYERLVEKGKGFKVRAKVFTMPAVQVGSILEYRYRKNFNYFYQDPTWFVQSDLYTLKEHFFWRPTDNALVDNTAGGKATTSVAWTPILPANAHVVAVKKHGSNELTLDLENVPPLPKEEYTPPASSLGDRVLFYYTAYKTTADFWAGAGKIWSDAYNTFIGPGPLVKKAVGDLLAPGDTEEAKVRKIYVVVSRLENSDYLRAREEKENKAAGYKTPVTTDDVLRQGRGGSRQLTGLFVAMVRAAGLKAYMMGVADRAVRIFLQPDLNMRQLDDVVAIVPLDGKDVYFDPGTPYCQFMHLSWRHALSGGLRQTETLPQLATTPSEPSAENHVTRLAELKVAGDGQVNGSVVLTYTGDPALTWRQSAALGDDTSLRTDLRVSLESALPGGMEVSVSKIENLTDRDQPLKITYTVSGPAGTSTGKRLLLPADIFEANAKPVFSAATRKLPVDLHYGSSTQDAVRYVLAPGLAIESAPKAMSQRFVNNATVSTSTLQTPGVESIVLRRNLNVARYIYPAADYFGLQTFYAAVQAATEEVLVVARDAP